MKVKEYRITENGDFDILISFSHEDIREIGLDTQYQFKQESIFMAAIIRGLKKHWCEENKEKEVE